MKKLLFLLVLSPFILMAQNSLPDIEIADSLEAGTDTTNVHDLSYGIPYVFGLGQWWISAKDTGSTYTDSAQVFAGTIRHNKRSGAAIDTLWKRILFKDTSWNMTNTITKAASETQWTPLIPMPALIKFVLINAQYISGRKWEYVIEAKKIKY